MLYSFSRIECCTQVCSAGSVHVCTADGHRVNAHRKGTSRSNTTPLTPPPPHYSCTPLPTALPVTLRACCSSVRDPCNPERLGPYSPYSLILCLPTRLQRSTRRQQRCQNQRLRRLLTLHRLTQAMAVKRQVHCVTISNVKDKTRITTVRACELNCIVSEIEAAVLASEVVDGTNESSWFVRDRDQVLVT
jgi:hypothetical protein